MERQLTFTNSPFAHCCEKYTEVTHIFTDAHTRILILVSVVNDLKLLIY